MKLLQHLPAGGTILACAFAAGLLIRALRHASPEEVALTAVIGGLGGLIVALLWRNHGT